MIKQQRDGSQLLYLQRDRFRKRVETLKRKKKLAVDQFAETCETIRNEIELKTESLIEQIRLQSDSLLKDIDTYETENIARFIDDQKYHEKFEKNLETYESELRKRSDTHFDSMTNRITKDEYELATKMYGGKKIYFNGNDKINTIPSSIIGKIEFRSCLPGVDSLFTKINIQKELETKSDTSNNESATNSITKTPSIGKNLNSTSSVSTANDNNNLKMKLIRIENFDNDKYIIFSSFFKSTEIAFSIFSSSAKLIKSGIDSNFKHNFQLTSTHYNNMVVFVPILNFGRCSISIIDDNLNLLKRVVTNEMKVNSVTCNSNEIFTLNSIGKISIYNWQLELTRKLNVQFHNDELPFYIRECPLQISYLESSSDPFLMINYYNQMDCISIKTGELIHNIRKRNRSTNKLIITNKNQIINFHYDKSSNGIQLIISSFPDNKLIEKYQVDSLLANASVSHLDILKHNKNDKISIIDYDNCYLFRPILTKT
jgi:hypothetical protein